MENKFKSLDDLLCYLPQIGNRPFLRNIVLECMPDCKEKYNVPFYYIVIPICYIWPATIPGKFERCGYWSKVIHFGLATANGLLTFNSLKETSLL
jgi:hypothetical protein